MPNPNLPKEALALFAKSGAMRDAAKVSAAQIKAYREAMLGVPLKERPTLEQWAATTGSKPALAAMGISSAPEMEHRTSKGQDQSTQPLTGSAMQALVRGWMAGTAGLPGDLEGLARKGLNFSFGAGGVDVNPDSALPTTDFYKEWLPGKQVGDENVSTVGSLFGGVGSPTMARGVTGALSQVGRGPVGKSAHRGIIKAPGGNWLSRGEEAHAGVGSPERALASLHHPYPNVNLAAVAKEMGVDQQDLLSSGIWRRGYGSIEGPTGPISLNKAINAINAGTPQHALNNFVDKQLTRYVKNDMATERDPIRALAERGITHKADDPLGLDQWIPESLGVARMNAGYPVHGVGVSDMAKNWENTTDHMVDVAKASAYTKPLTAYEQRAGLRSMVTDENDWLEKVNPNTTVHAMQGDTRDLGFQHLIDELHNAIDPNSGLPAHLQLDPKSLDRVSVPQAVERVAAINAWRAENKAAADAQRANNAATHLHKEYPHADTAPNPKGLKWVELKLPEPTGKKSQITTTGKDELGFNDIDAPGDQMDALEDHLVDLAADEGLHAGMPRFNGFIDRMREKLLAPKTKEVDEGYKQLQDALKYEGDTMGHCVGGYCDDVADGSTRIFSLRDAKGQPHVTVEAAPEVRTTDLLGFHRHQMSEKGKAEIDAALGPLAKDAGVGPRDLGFYDIQKSLIEQHPEWASYNAQETPIRIVQIKGKGNAKPKDDYIPFVQDFVKSGKWGDVGDLQNSGLMHRSKSAVEWPAGYSVTDVNKALAAHKGDPVGAYLDEVGGDYAAPRDFHAWLKKVPPEGFAEGGAVTQPQMTREDFLKKYGPTFVANDKGGNAASEVAGMDVGQYYDTNIGPNAQQPGLDDNGNNTVPIWMSTAGKYSNSAQANDADGWTAYDYVNPHPESNDLGGFGEFWKAVGRPIATGAALYAGVGALAGAGGAGAAAGTGGSAGIGSGTVLGGGAAVAPTATGLAGTLGMAPGYMATALNTGALNTGMGLLRGNNIGDALKSGATSALLSPVSSYVGDLVGGGYTGQILGNTALGGVQGAINGQGFSKGLENGLINGAVSAAGSYMGGLAKDATDSKFAGTAANALTQSTLKGKPLEQSLDALATQYAAGELTDLTGLSPTMASIVVNLAKGRTITPKGALSQAAGAVGSAKLKQLAVG